VATPTLVCPNCGQTLEYHATIEMLDPPVGKVDTGYCVRCERLLERIRETGTFYDSTLWPPLCRLCRQPVSFAAITAPEADAPTVLFRCRVHHSEQWGWNPATERWMRNN
jgi:hypothetical protein